MSLFDLIGGNDAEWMGHPGRNCSDPAHADKWFPGANADRYAQTRYARQICDGCPVLNQCLEYAVNDASLEGVWGGTTPNERRNMRQPSKQGRRKGYGQLERKPVPTEPEKRRIAVCVACERTMKIHARNMCSTCVKRERKNRAA